MADINKPVPITISKNITIDGSSKDLGGFSVIDGRNLTGLFVIKGKLTVNFIHMEFINGNAEMGAAIYNEPIKQSITTSNENDTFVGFFGETLRSTLSVYNSKFINNSAIKGGAINFYKVSTHNNVFINNTATFGGCVLAYETYSNSDIFINNKAKLGGALYGENMEIYDSVGGAIWKDVCGLSERGSNIYDYVNVHNSIFINNSAVNGSAIYSNFVNIDNSKFYNNNASCDGAVFGCSKIYLVNSTFVNNSANRNGGAICAHNLAWNNNHVINSSIFIGNTAENGAAIWTCAILNISNSLFENNTVLKDGGAVYSRNNIDVSCSNFTNNKAKGDGGAIFLPKSSGYVVVYSSINDVTLDSPASSVYMFISNSIFKDNGAKNGGAIATEYLLVNKTIFSNNSAVRGGAISCPTFKIDESLFENNSASSDGGAIYSKNAYDSTLNNSIFIGNKAGYGGVILYSANMENVYFDSKDAIPIYDCNVISSTFINNSAKLGGVIYYDYAVKSNVMLSNFTGNVANEGGVVYYGSRTPLVTTGYYGKYDICYSTNCTIRESNFNNNQAISGGVVYYDCSNNCSILDSNFKDNVATSGGVVYYYGGNGYVIDNVSMVDNRADKGGAIYYQDCYESFIINSVFKYNNAVDGGAVYYNASKYCNVINSIFETNKATNEGGAIFYASYKRIIYKSNQDSFDFTGNITIGTGNAGGIESNDNSGLVVSGPGDILRIEIIQPTNCTVSKSQFMENIAGFGGAIYGHGLSNHKTVDSIFINNSASYGGAALNYDLASDSLIKNSIFINNSGYLGGAIRYGARDKNIFGLPNNECLDYNCSVVNSTFINNSAKYGGAIYYVHDKDCSLINSTFINNSAEDSGGAIYYSLYFAAAGTGPGLTPILFVHDCNVINSTFRSNSATNEGGAIYYDYTSNNSLINVGFIDNSAKFGGAIYYDHESNSTIYGGTFINNKANSGGAVYYNYAFNCSIVESNFKNNNASLGGAIVYVDAQYCQINDSVFMANIAQSGGAIYHKAYSHNAYFIKNMSAITAVPYASPNYDVYNPDVICYLECLISNSQFIGNIANGGGAILYNGVFNSIIKDSSFVNNSANSGGAIYHEIYEYFIDFNSDSVSSDSFIKVYSLNCTIMNSSFVNNSANKGGAIAGTYIDVKDSNFINNSATLVGGAIYSFGGPSGAVFGNVFVGSIREENNFINASNCKFENNKANDDGGALYGSHIFAEESEFINNTAIKGGAIYSILELSLLNSIFDSNKARLGGAVYGIYRVSLSKNEFRLNKADEKGGAVYTVLGLSLNDSKFSGNHAFEGGAVYFNLDNKIYNSTFTNNSADVGGAITGDDNVFSSVVLLNSTFINNTALKTGGAIEYCTITAENSTFINNKANDGGAISGSHLIISNSTFDNNIAIVNGGAINAYYCDVMPDCQLSNSKFSSNLALRGTSVYIYGDKVSVSKCNFKDDTPVNNIIFKDIFDDLKNESLIINVNNITMSVNDKAELVIGALFNDSPVKNIDLIVSIGGVAEIRNTGEEGVIVIPIELPVGHYDVVVSYCGSQFKNSSAIATIEVTLPKLFINAENIDMYFKDETRFVISALANDRIVKNLNLTVFINGVKDVRKTNDEGVIRMSINLPPGEYLVVVSYDGDEYEKVNTTAFIVVKSMIHGDDIIKFFKNETHYNASFFDKNGSALANAKVGFNINGVIYNRTTNSDGVASLKINLGPGKYVLTAINYATGEMKSNNVTVLSILVENNDLVKYFQNGTQYVVKLLDKQGNVLEGEKVVFNVNGLVYSRTTNGDGIARFDINLGPGNYIITASYDSCFVSNNITVLSILVDNGDLVKYFQNGTQYVVKLLDKQGNAYKGGKVSFNINGQVYTRTTDENGVASFAINLGPGKYIITASYDGCFVSNNITVLPTVIANDLNMKFGDGSKFSTKVVDKQGNAVQGKKVTFNINGILYTRISDANGLASLDINLPSGKYIITTSCDDLSIGKTVKVR